MYVRSGVEAAREEAAAAAGRMWKKKRKRLAQQANGLGSHNGKKQRHEQ